MEKLKRVKLLGEARAKVQKVQARTKGSKGSSFLEKLNQGGFKRFKLPQEAKTGGSKGSSLPKKRSRPEKESIGQIKMADRPNRVPTGQIYGRWQQNTGWWPLAMAGDVWGCLTSHSLPLKSKTQVFGAKPNTKQSSREILRQGA